MLPEQPKAPQGHHVLLLRNHLGFTQTQFGALLGIAQPRVSDWETTFRNEDLAPELVERFFDVWDCLPTRPPGGFDEAMAILALHLKWKNGGKIPVEEPRAETSPEGEGARPATPPLHPSLSALAVAATRLALTLNKAAAFWLARERASKKQRDGRYVKPIPPPALARRWEVLTGFLTVGVLIVGTTLFRDSRFWRLSWFSDSEVDAQQEPLKPFKGQKQSPCNPTNEEFEVDKLCWWEVKARICPPGTATHQNRCLLPVLEGTREPRADVPK